MIWSTLAALGFVAAVEAAAYYPSAAAGGGGGSGGGGHHHSADPTIYVVTDEVMPGTTPADNLNMKVLRNTGTGEFVKIIWDFGGRVEDLTLMSESRGALKPVLVTHDNNASAVRANFHWAGAMLAPFANRIANGTYTFEGQTHYLPRNEVRCGGECDNALHGFLWNKKMTVLSAVVTNESAALTLGYNFDGTDPGYPFGLDMRISYELSGRRLLVRCMSAEQALLPPPIAPSMRVSAPSSVLTPACLCACVRARVRFSLVQCNACIHRW